MSCKYCKAQEKAPRTIGSAQEAVAVTTAPASLRAQIAAAGLCCPGEVRTKEREKLQRWQLLRGIGCLAGTAAFPGPNCFPCCYLQDNFKAVTSSGTLLSSVLSDREVRALPILLVIVPLPLRAMSTTYEECLQSNATSQSAQAV